MKGTKRHKKKTKTKIEMRKGRKKNERVKN
jgi:hypothetical protein